MLARPLGVSDTGLFHFGGADSTPAPTYGGTTAVCMTTCFDKTSYTSTNTSCPPTRAMRSSLPVAVDGNGRDTGWDGADRPAGVWRMGKVASSSVLRAR